MRRIMLFSLAMILLAFLLPLAFASAPKAEASPEAPQEDAAEEEATRTEEDAPLLKSSVIDRDISLAVQTESGIENITMADYLPMTLAAEMPAAFQPEALKAQAVALRSYILYCRENRKSTHPEADVCTDPQCCTAFLDEEQLREKWGGSFDTYYGKILSAVTETDGQYLAWQDEPALAVFHSSSMGQTEDGGNVWSALPYLVSVESPETEEDVTNLISTVEVSQADFKATVLSLYPDARLDGGPEGWTGKVQRNSSGRVGSIEVGGVEITGTAMRSMFSLRSTDFDLEYNGESFVFTVRGYGHGVGMSQYGANVMARQGSNYAEILEHYYPGTELVVSVKYESSAA